MQRNELFCGTLASRGSIWWILIVGPQSSFTAFKVSDPGAHQEIAGIREAICGRAEAACLPFRRLLGGGRYSHSSWARCDALPSWGEPQRLGPRDRSAVSGLPDIAHQRRATLFPQSTPRRLCPLRWNARAARPTSRTGLTIRVGALRPDFADSRQSTALLVLLLPWPGRCLYAS
jgi:hypothetical protein